MKEPKARMNISMSQRLKRRLEMAAHDKEMKQNDIVVSALNDALDRMDMEHSAPDLVLDRMSQILNSQMIMTNQMGRIEQSLRKRDDEDVDY